MYYSRRTPKKSMRDYFMPFFIIIVLIAIVVVGWRTLNKVFIQNNVDVTSERVLLNIESGSAKAMMEGKAEWKNAPNNIYLYKGEKIETSLDGRAELTFFEQSVTRMEKGSEVEFTQLKKQKEANVINLTLNNGEIWTKVENIVNPDSSFTIDTDLITVETKGGVVDILYPATVQVIQGSAQVSIKSADEVIKTVNVGVGQQFTIDETGISDLAENLDTTLIFAMSDEFKSSDWYTWNMRQDGAIAGFEEPGTEGDEASTTDEDATTDTETDNKTDTDTDKVTDTETDTVTDTETDKTDTTVDEETDENDKTPPADPVITDPGGNGKTVTIDDIEQVISGTVSSDTYAVVVNDYKLGKYIPGTKSFKYYAKTSYGNLVVGDNEFEIYAEDKAGNKSDTVKITLVLDQKTFDEKKAESTEDTGTTSVPSSTSSGGVKITSPNGGESLTTSETSFDIKGEVPAGTAKVVVNDYTLTKFTEGDTAFAYKASSAMGSLEIGEKNTYTVKAYDKDDELLGTASITIDVQSGSASAPTITMPSSEGAYNTTLDQVALGGAVGKWVQKVYVNDEVLSSYIPGSEKWSKSVTLTTGANTFTIYGEQDGVKTATATITITYQP